jgi:hypothetical protein
MEKAVQKAKADDLSKKLSEATADLKNANSRGDELDIATLTERIKDLNKKIEFAKNWNFESQLDLEINDKISSTFEMAALIEEALKKFEIETGAKIKDIEDKSRMLAADAYGGGVTMEDINDWLDTTSLLLKTAKDEGISLNEDKAKAVQKAMYIVDSWFKLGIAENLESEPFEKDVVLPKVKQILSKENLGESIDEETMKKIVAVMERKDISPVAIEFLLKDAQKLKNEISEAAGRSEAPREIHDLNQRITTKD